MQKHAGVPTEGKFTEGQAAFLQFISDHVTTFFRFEREDLEYSPFDAQGGLGKMHQLFGHSMDILIEELNEGLWRKIPLLHLMYIDQQILHRKHRWRTRSRHNASCCARRAAACTISTLA